MTKAKHYDEEFSPDMLSALKKRDILGQANPVQLVPLLNHAFIEARSLERRFQEERRENPLLETTQPEAWIAAELVPMIREVRSRACVDESILAEAVKRYVKRRTSLQPMTEDSKDQQLYTTIEPFLPASEKLMLDICDRRKSLRGVLGIRQDAYTVREALTLPKASSQREAIFVQGIKEKWLPHRIAKELDDKGIKPRNLEYRSFKQILQIKPQLFYSMKNQIKKKYLY